jgi:small subunit ribosomal protein S8
MPASKLKLDIARVLKQEGFVGGYEVEGDPPKQVLRIYLKYTLDKRPVITDVRRVSKPGLRAYAGWRQIPLVAGGLGIAIVSTPRGVMPGYEARRRRLGGEVLCYVW